MWLRSRSEVRCSTVSTAAVIAFAQQQAILSYLHKTLPVFPRCPTAPDFVAEVQDVLDMFELLLDAFQNMMILLCCEYSHSIKTRVDPINVGQWSEQPDVEQLPAQWRDSSVQLTIQCEMLLMFDLGRIGIHIENCK